MPENTPNRRDVLKKLGASTAALAGVGTASARRTRSRNGEPGELEGRYENPDRVRDTVATEAGEVLNELADRGIVAAASPDVFDLDNRVEATEIETSAAVDGWAVTEYEKGEGSRTAHILVSKATDTHALTLHVQPQADRNYALVRSTESGEEFAIDPATERVKLPKKSGQDGVSAQNHLNCSDEKFCTDNVCMYIQRHGLDQCWTTYITMSCHESYDRCHCYEESESCSYQDIDSPGCTC